MSRRFLLAAALSSALLGPRGASAATFSVGPGQPLTTCSEVPWESLAPGDTVEIHWQPTPYRDKWVICRQGAPGAPITVRGIPGPAGERPVISGEGATTRLALNFWNEERGVIKIGGASVPPDTKPTWIVVEGLEVRSAHPDYSFTDDGSNTTTYARNAAAIYVEKAENLVIRDCVLHDSGNGLFIGSPATDPTRDVLVEGNALHGNGNVGSAYEHNSYTAVLGILFQYNRYGALRPGADGNNLKDRSAGLVVRYNWIESGNRQLDLVDAEDSSIIATDPSYSRTFVYGNVLVETEGAGNRQVCHYGGDSGVTSQYRKGMLHFYNNTVVSTRTDRTTLFRLSTNEERCDARNNVVATVAAAGSSLSLLAEHGILDWSHQWLEPGWTISFDGAFDGTLNDDGTSLEGASAGFVDEAAADYHLGAGSPCLDTATALHADALPDHDVVREYAEPLSGIDRAVDAALDIGAHERAAAALPPVADFTLTPSFGLAPLGVQFTDLSTNTPVSWEWDFEDDGVVDSTEQHPFHPYPAGGIYSVRLTAANVAGSDETVRVAAVCVAAAVPGAPLLRVRARGDRVEWGAAPDGAGHDLVRGSLAVLRSTGGDFDAAVTDCLGADVPVLGVDDPVPPEIGGAWYLARGVTCGVAGSYGLAGRDAGLARAPACP